MLILASLFFAGFYLNKGAAFAVNFVAEQALEDPYNALPDIIHIYTPKINIYIPDTFLLLCFVYSLSFAGDFHELEQNMWTLATCIIIRSISVFL